MILCVLISCLPMGVLFDRSSKREAVEPRRCAYVSSNMCTVAMLVLDCR